MAIDTQGNLIKAMNNNSQRIVIDKATLSNMLSGFWGSMWTAGGFPGVGATPSAVAVCTQALAGSLPITNPVGSTKKYIASVEALSGTSLYTAEFHDRLVHMGGLSGTVTTAQNVLIDLSTLLATSNLDGRKGDANYSDVQWWLENYSDCGSTTVNITINAKFNDGTDANLTVLSLQRFRVGQAYLLNNLIAAAQAGKFIRGINNITLSATTTGAGNFGVTATRYRGSIFMHTANKPEKKFWYELGLPEVPASACMSMFIPATVATSGLFRALIQVANG